MKAFIPTVLAATRFLTADAEAQGINWSSEATMPVANRQEVAITPLEQYTNAVADFKNAAKALPSAIRAPQFSEKAVAVLVEECDRLITSTASDPVGQRIGMRLAVENLKRLTAEARSQNGAAQKVLEDWESSLKNRGMPTPFDNAARQRVSAARSALEEGTLDKFAKAQEEATKMLAQRKRAQAAQVFGGFGLLLGVVGLTNIKSVVRLNENLSQLLRESGVKEPQRKALSRALDDAAKQSFFRRLQIRLSVLAAISNEAGCSETATKYERKVDNCLFMLPISGAVIGCCAVLALSSSIGIGVGTCAAILISVHLWNKFCSKAGSDIAVAKLLKDYSAPPEEPKIIPLRVK